MGTTGDDGFANSGLTGKDVILQVWVNVEDAKCWWAMVGFAVKS
jgi:hypothetical protein